MSRRGWLGIGSMRDSGSSIVPGVAPSPEADGSAGGVAGSDLRGISAPRPRPRARFFWPGVSLMPCLLPDGPGIPWASSRYRSAPLLAMSYSSTGCPWLGASAKRIFCGMMVSNSVVLKYSRSSSITWRPRLVRESYSVTNTPSMRKFGLSTSRTCSMVSTNSLIPTIAKNSGSMGINTLSAAVRALMVRRSKLGGQSIKMNSKVSRKEAKASLSRYSRRSVLASSMPAPERSLWLGKRRRWGSSGLGTKASAAGKVTDQHIVQALLQRAPIHAHAKGCVGLRVQIHQ